MRKILLISDTHGHLDQKLLKYIEAADEVWHAGDIGEIEVCTHISKLKPLRAVWGNIDGSQVRANFPEHLSFVCEGVNVLITHIGGYPGKYPTEIKNLIRQHGPDLFICGHSHILKVMNDKEFDLLHMNPGACGVQGFHTIKTALQFQIEGSEIKNLAIIELGSRTSLPS